MTSTHLEGSNISSSTCIHLLTTILVIIFRSSQHKLLLEMQLQLYSSSSNAKTRIPIISPTGTSFDLRPLEVDQEEE